MYPADDTMSGKILFRLWFIPASLAGIISGISWTEVVNLQRDFPRFFPFFHPGISYGVVQGCYFFFFLRPAHSIVKLMLWIFVSSLSYIAILTGVIFLSVPFVLNAEGTYKSCRHDGTWFSCSPSITDSGIMYGLGGLAGALVLGIGFHFIFLRLNLSSFIVLLVAGILIPLLIPFGLGIPYVFTIWLTMVMLVFGNQINLKHKKSSVNMRAH